MFYGICGRSMGMVSGFSLTLSPRAGIGIGSSSCARSVAVRVCHNLAITLFDISWPHTWWIKSKVSLPVISHLLRHKNLQTTERYLQALDPRFRDTMKLLEGNLLEPTHNLLTKEKGGQKTWPPCSQTIGGSAWESNPPTPLFRRYTGFEVRGPHQ